MGIFGFFGLGGKSEQVYPESKQEQNSEQETKDFAASNEYLAGRLRNFAIKATGGFLSTKKDYEQSKTNTDYTLYRHDLENLTKNTEYYIDDLSNFLGSKTDNKEMATRIAKEAIKKLKGIKKSSVFDIRSNTQIDSEQHKEDVIEQAAKFEGDAHSKEFFISSAVIDLMEKQQQKDDHQGFFGNIRSSFISFKPVENSIISRGNSPDSKNQPHGR